MSKTVVKLPPVRKKVKKKPPAAHRAPARAKADKAANRVRTKDRIAKRVRREVEARVDLSRSVLTTMLGTVESFEQADAALKTLAPKIAAVKKALAEAAEKRIAAVKATDAKEQIEGEDPGVVLLKVEREAIKAENNLSSLEVQATGHKEARKQTMAELRDLVREAAKGQMLFTVSNDPPARGTVKLAQGEKPAESSPAAARAGGGGGVPTSPDAWRSNDVKVLLPHGATEALLEKLYADGIRTLGDLADRTANQYDKIKGVGATGRDKLSDATAAWFKANPPPKAGAAPAKAEPTKPEPAKAKAEPPLKGGLESTQGKDTPKAADWGGDVDVADDVAGEVRDDDEG